MLVKVITTKFQLFLPKLIMYLAARVDRMKEAKSESEQIIAAYKKELEASYQASIANVIFSRQYQLLLNYCCHVEFWLFWRR